MAGENVSVPFFIALSEQKRFFPVFLPFLKNFCNIFLLVTLKFLLHVYQNKMNVSLWYFSHNNGKSNKLVTIVINDVLFGQGFLHSQKQMVQWAVYVTAEFYACMLSGWFGCNFCTAYVQPNGGGTYTVINQLTLVWVRLIQQLIHSSNWMGHGRSYHFFNIFFFLKKI